MKKPSAPQLPAVRPIAAIFADDDDDGDTVSKRLNMRIFCIKKWMYMLKIV